MSNRHPSSTSYTNTPSGSEHPGRIYWVERGVEPSGSTDGGAAAGKSRFRIPSDVLALSFVEGLWAELNSRLGLLFDEHEDQFLTPGQCADCASLIVDFVGRYVEAGLELTRVVARISAGPGEPLIDRAVTMSTRVFCDHLLAMAAFLREAYERNMSVRVSL